MSTFTDRVDMCPPVTVRHPAAQSVGVLVSEDSHAFDVSTIASIFNCANRLKGQTLYDLSIVGQGFETVSAEGVQFKTLPLNQILAPIDIVIVTSNVLRAHQAEPPHHSLVAVLNLARRWCAIDGGILTLASLGMLSKRRVAARPQIARFLAQIHPHLLVDEHKLFACDGNLWSCPSGAPVVDMCLALVEDGFGRKIANDIALELLVPGRRSGDQPQISPILLVQSRGGRDRALAGLIEWLGQNVNVRIDVPALAARVSMSERNFHRRFKAYTGYTPADYINMIRADQARQLMLAEVSLKEVAGYVGFASPSLAARALKRTAVQVANDRPVKNLET